ncbi:hypothetical protein NA56DRAFT_700959 [Hyaloscypha hepaticicola]|uniref:Uncharacterized protein n=1 Tax=Hyaloscypha hepaticicola TaxID=2082293 RepID=A0A2J6QBD3_9HELO|nr:hypothetical protein NA56DRAFT_700959 [Hyaloscypha hepaticicola]
MCCQSMLQADLHTRRRVLDPSRPSQDASSPTQSFAWNSSHNRTVIWKINDSTSSLISSHMRNSIHVPQVHVLMPLTARTVQPNFGSGLCSCSRVPKPAQPTNSKAKRRSAGVHRRMGQGLPICEEEDPRLHISGRLYARRGAPVHSQTTANHLHHQKPSIQQDLRTSPPIEPHLTSSRIWI